MRHMRRWKISGSATLAITGGLHPFILDNYPSSRAFYVPHFFLLLVSISKQASIL